MNTTGDEDEDPYSIIPRSGSESSSDDVSCCHERVLLECWCLKQSRVLQHWRRRWIVLTPTKLLSFHTERGYLHGESSTDSFEVDTLCGARLLDAKEMRMLAAAATSTPLSCFANLLVFRGAAELPSAPLRTLQQCSFVQLRLGSGGRLLHLDVAPDEGASRARLLARELVTAAVNGACAARSGLPEYWLPGVVHAFEPRGLVTLRCRYSLGKALGRGSFGMVYQAASLQTGRAVAVKRVSLLFMREQVRSEAEILREVRHPHVVRLLDYVEEGRSVAYLVMELLPGGDLYSQVVQRYGCAGGKPAAGSKGQGYSERDVREILRMALSGLSAIHDHAVVHRDLKPENVLLLDRRGELLEP